VVATGAGAGGPDGAALVEQDWFFLWLPWVYTLGQGTVDFGDIFYGQWCTRHSFLIANTSDTMLHFTLNSNAAQHPNLEINFTTSFRSPPVLIRRLAVPPKQHVRVFIRLLVLGPAGASAASSDAGDGVPLGAAGSEPVQVSVTCRSVRHSHRALVLSGVCRAPLLAVGPMAAAFRLVPAAGVGAWQQLKRRPASRRPTPTDHEGEAVPFTVVYDVGGTILYDVARRQQAASVPAGVVRTRALDAPAEFEITSAAPADIALRTDSLYFSFTLGGTAVAPGAPVIATVTPRLDAIQQHLDRLVRAQYVHEYATVYNRARPSESHRIVVSLRLGAMVAFQALPRGPLRVTLATFETRVGDFVAQVHAAAERGGAAALGTGDLMLEYTYIVDELLEFGLLLRSSSDFPFNLQLANLLFTVLFQHPVFTEHAPAALPGWLFSNSSGGSSDGGGGGGGVAMWPPALAPFVRKFVGFLQYFTNDSPTMLQLRRLCLRLVLLPATSNTSALGGAHSSASVRAQPAHPRPEREDREL
jgi:hypothetical protein